MAGLQLLLEVCQQPIGSQHRQAAIWSGSKVTAMVNKTSRTTVRPSSERLGCSAQPEAAQRLEYSPAERSES